MGLLDQDRKIGSDEWNNEDDFTGTEGHGIGIHPNAS